MKMLIKVFKFILNLEEPSVYYANEKQLMCVCFCLTTGLYKFYHTSAQMGIPCKKYVLEELWKTNSQNSHPTQVLK